MLSSDESSTDDLAKEAKINEVSSTGEGRKGKDRSEAHIV